jgi:hypothetical protein
MREASSNKSGASPRLNLNLRANSLFRNILPASPFASRFCPDRPRYQTHKSFKARILTSAPKKKCGTSTSPRGREQEAGKPRGVKYLSKP